MQYFNKFTKSLIENLKAMPIAIIFAYMATILALFAVNNGNLLRSDNIVKSIAYLVFGYFLVASLYLFKRGTILAVGLVLFALVAIYGYYLEKWYFVILSAFLIAASLLVAIWGPFYGKESTNIELFNQALVVVGALCMAIILSTFLIGGVLIALLAFKVLFGVHIYYKIPSYIAIVIFGVFGANYYLYQLRHTKIQNINIPLQALLAKYILPIFTIGYFLILYAYTLKIIYIYKLPNGHLAWIIVLFSFVALLSYFYLTPYKHRYKKYILVAIIPQAIMLLVALYQRIQQYSFTEFRYMLVVYALFLIIASLYLLRRDNYKNFFIILSATALFVSISSIEVAKIAQKQIFLNALKEYRSGNKSFDVKYKLSSTISYLTSRWGVEIFEDSLPKITQKIKKYSKSRYYNVEKGITEALGFKYISKYDYKIGKARDSIKVVYLSNYNAQGDISGYRYFFKAKGYLRYKNILLKKSKTNVVITLTKNSIIVKKGTNKTTIDLKDFIKKLYTTKDKEHMNFSYKDGNIDLKLTIIQASLEEDKIVDIDSILFYK